MNARSEILGRGDNQAAEATVFRYTGSPLSHPHDDRLPIHNGTGVSYTRSGTTTVDPYTPKSPISLKYLSDWAANCTKPRSKKNKTVDVAFWADESGGVQ